MAHEADSLDEFSLQVYPQCIKVGCVENHPPHNWAATFGSAFRRNTEYLPLKSFKRDIHGKDSISGMAHNTQQRQERRENPRLKLRVPFELRVEGSGTPIRGATSDLSLGGCYIETIFPFPLNTTLELILQIGSTVLVVGRVVTRDPNVGNGIKFTRLLPEDREELRSYLEAASVTSDGISE